jgi:hypothetical protein
MQAHFTGHRLQASTALTPVRRGFDKGLWQSTTNSWNFEGKPKCKHFDSPSGATEGRRRLLFLMCSHSTRQIHWSSAPLILSILFECGLRSLESSSSGQQHLRIIRVRAFLSLESFYSGQQRLYVIRVWVFLSLESFYLGQQRLCVIRVRAFLSLELFYSGQQRLCVIRVRALVSRIILFGPAAPLRYSTAGFGPSNYSLRASSASMLFECGFRSLESHLSTISAFILLGYRLLSFESLFCATNAFEIARNMVAIRQFGCRMSNTKVSPQLATLDGPVFISSALCRDNFRAYSMKTCTDGHIGCFTITGL